MKNTLEFNLEIIIDEYGAYVYKIVDNIIGNTLPYQDKEEIISDTFYLLWKNQDKIKTNLKSYLSKIAKNASYNKLRNNKFTNDLDDNTASYNSDFDFILDMKEKLKQLNNEELTIFNLFYLKGFKVKEISKLVNKSTSAIKIILYRIRKKLKEAK